MLTLRQPRSRRHAARISAVVGTAAAVTLAMAGNAFAADTGLDYSLDIPAVDVSGVEVAASVPCQMGPVGLNTHLGRTSSVTAALESALGSASSTCSGITMTVSIVDSDLTHLGSDVSVSRSFYSSGKKVSGSVAQTVSWADPTSPNGLRPLTRVVFKVVGTSHGKSSCLQLNAIVVAGSEATSTVVAC